MPHALDRENMEAVIRDSPGQFADGLAAAAPITRAALTNVGRPLQVLLAGMGGSWMAGALVRDAGLSAVRLDLHRGYGLPPGLRRETVVIASSFSGNTEETLSAYEAAREAGVSLIGVAAGGTLAERCAADGVPFVRIPADPPTMQPRSATGYGVGILTGLLASLGVTVVGAVDAVRSLGPFLSRVMDETRARGEALVPELRDTTPIIYAADRFATVARIWKIKVNENAKVPAFWNVFPELNHNEMIGWTTQPGGRFHVVLLRSPDDHPRVQKRFDITLALLKERGVLSSIVSMTGESIAERIFSTLLIGDWMSFALALAYGVNPSPVPLVEDLKRRLKE